MEDEFELSPLILPCPTKKQQNVVVKTIFTLSRYTQKEYSGFSVHNHIYLIILLQKDHVRVITKK